jgi:hypothetical protein
MNNEPDREPEVYVNQDQTTGKWTVVHEILVAEEEEVKPVKVAESCETRREAKELAKAIKSVGWDISPLH